MIKRDDTEINLNKNIYEVIEDILVQDFNISTPSKYIDLLIRIVGELNDT